jgi:hypothetical protein
MSEDRLMLITRILPTVAELVALAIVKTPFVAESIGPDSHDLRISAELCAELAAEFWENERGAVAGVTISPDLTAETAVALEAHGRTMRDASDNALYQAHAKLGRAIALLATAQRSVAGTLPLAAAEVLMDGIEDDFANIRVALTRAAEVTGNAIDSIEWAASARRLEAA